MDTATHILLESGRFMNFKLYCEIIFVLCCRTSAHLSVITSLDWTLGPFSPAYPLETASFPLSCTSSRDYTDLGPPPFPLSCTSSQDCTDLGPPPFPLSCTSSRDCTDLGPPPFPLSCTSSRDCTDLGPPPLPLSCTSSRDCTDLGPGSSLSSLLHILSQVSNAHLFHELTISTTLGLSIQPLHSMQFCDSVYSMKKYNGWVVSL